MQGGDRRGDHPGVVQAQRPREQSSPGARCLGGQVGGELHRSTGVEPRHPGLGDQPRPRRFRPREHRGAAGVHVGDQAKPRGLELAAEHLQLREAAQRVTIGQRPPLSAPRGTHCVSQPGHHRVDRDRSGRGRTGLEGCCAHIDNLGTTTRQSDPSNPQCAQHLSRFFPGPRSDSELAANPRRTARNLRENLVIARCEIDPGDAVEVMGPQLSTPTGVVVAPRAGSRVCR